MKKIIVLLAVLSVVMSSVFAGGSSESASEVKIGFIGPLTGDYANYGVFCNNAVQLAVDKANAAGGVNGVKIVLIAEDSEGDPAKGLAAIEKLSSSDKIVALIGPVLTGTSFTVGERCQNEGLLMISPSATHKNITAIGDYIFRTVASDGLQGEVAGAYFAQVLGYKSIAVLYAKNDYSQGLYEGLTESFEKAGGKIVLAETCQVGDKDFKTQLTRIKAAKPDAIYIPDYTAEMAQILEQASQLGINIPFLSCDGFSNPEIYSLAPNFTDGVVYLGPTQVEESKAYKDFVAEYSSKFGKEPDSFATNAYDGTCLLIECLKSVYSATGKFDRKAIRDAVASIKDFQGVTGLINFAPNGDLVAYQGVYVVEGTTPVYQGAYTVVDGMVKKVE
ncbi:MAG: ABC transporter substrate-binding protein [Sphaerochaetaceae bacterium]|jgi:branched-chain amino acid transport system substrate-binding protein|nr:ABC transporter substrate-binding protein [Sphaerochaetaceae bacterium]